MNQIEKDIINVLLNGGHIVNGNGRIVARDKSFNPVKKVTARRFQLLKDILKKNKKGMWLISPAAILKLRANSWVKVEYKKLKKSICKTRQELKKHLKKDYLK